MLKIQEAYLHFDNLISPYTFSKIPYNISTYYGKGHERMMEDNLNEKEIIDVAIRTYCNLQRIKKHEKDANPELEYQLKEARAKLAVYGVNIRELEY